MNILNRNEIKQVSGASKECSSDIEAHRRLQCSISLDGKEFRKVTNAWAGKFTKHLSLLCDADAAKRVVSYNCTMSFGGNYIYNDFALPGTGNLDFKGIHYCTLK